ncbi:TonB-dependent receptor plug domain-containing protein [Novosphingobium kunmingense]|uniref:TonB-dependent receptor plug domain-containing protein n=1 Tax=Novosphingobium kunmingense TaxID=1211806 RepID=UPI0012FD0A0F|nr:TonB-dependent receptor [Novosphingobium kunmingense]
MAAVSWLGITAGTAFGQTTTESEPADDTQQIVVTGTYLGGVRQEDRASPVLTVDAEALDRTGVSSLGDLTRFIPQNVGSAGGMQDLAKGGADTRDTRSVNLRGLGAGSTLVLLNGRRVTPQGGDDFVNLNALTPDIAIGRVETVLDGASSTYGADAVAGVFNVITNTRFEGVKLSAQYTGIDKSSSWNVQGMIGLGNDTIRSVTSASYRFVDNLQNSDRAITNFFNPSGAGFPGRYTLLARPTNASGGNLVIGGNDYTALYDARAVNGRLTVVDPNCGAAGTESQYIPATGATFGLGNCAYNFQPKNPIRPRSQSINIHNDTTIEVADNQEVFVELAYYHQESKRFGVPSYAQNAGNATMPAANPYNVFRVPVIFLGRAIGAQGFPGGYDYRVMRDTVDNQHYVLGARGDLFAGWKYTANVSYSGSHTIARDKDTDMNLFQAALNGFGGPNCNYLFNGAGGGAVAGAGNCLYYSPLQGNLQQMDPTLIHNLQTDVYFDFKREYYLAEAVVNGTLATIGGHNLDVAIGGQYRRENSTAQYSDLLLSGFGGFLGKRLNTSFRRNVKSGFIEANYEVIDGLNVNAAARYEDYGGFNTTAPKLAINWRIIPEISVRGSASRAFQAPTISNGSNSLISTGVGNVTDPTKSPPDTTFRTIQTFGNPGLQPQTADVYNIGATVLPVPRARLSVDYWSYKYKNQIQLQSAQAVVNASPNGPAVIRDSSGNIQAVQVTSFNAPSGTQTSGIDFAAAYSFDMGELEIGLRSNLTYLLKYDIDIGSTTPGAASIVYNGVGFRNQFVQSPLSSSAAPRWRAVSGIDFGYGRHSLSTTWRYTSGVVDDQGLSLNTSGTGSIIPATATSKIKAFSVFDVQYSVKLGQDDKYELAVGMINAFDTAPGFARFNGYLPSIADPFGRQIYARIQAKF